MARSEESVSTSVERLIEEEKERRLFELRAAQRRKEESEAVEHERVMREIAEAEAAVRLGTVKLEAQLDSERRQHEAKGEAARRQVAELEAELARLEMEQATKRFGGNASDQVELQRLRGWVRILASLLCTLGLGTVLMIFFFVVPERSKAASAWAELSARHQETVRQMRAEQKSLNERLERGLAREDELSARLSRVQSSPTQPPAVLPNPPRKSKRPTQHPPASRHCTCDPHDPLCEC